jgi:hypothetical protein
MVVEKYDIPHSNLKRMLNATASCTFPGKKNS